MHLLTARTTMRGGLTTSHTREDRAETKVDVSHYRDTLLLTAGAGIGIVNQAAVVLVEEGGDQA